MTALVLTPILDLKAAAPLQAELLALRGGPVSLDASTVERLGGLCLQVLLSAQRTWAHDGQDFQLSAPSSAFCDQWTAFGAAPISIAPQELHA